MREAIKHAPKDKIIANMLKRISAANEKTKSEKLKKGMGLEMLQNLDPKELRRQAEMLRTMHPDAIRQDPTFRDFTSEQIDQTAKKLEEMADTYYQREGTRRNDGNFSKSVKEKGKRRKKKKKKANGGEGSDSNNAVRTV